MNHDVALRMDWLCELYLQAMERQNFDALDRLWELARHDVELAKAFREINEGLLGEAREKQEQQTITRVGELVDRHLPSATRIPEPAPRLTVADVMREMGRQAASQPMPEMAELLTRLAASRKCCRRNWD